jgi:hypothetical protein
MNQNFSQSINPLQEHMINQEKFRTQSNLSILCIGLLLGGIICFVIMNKLPTIKLKADERKT